MTGEQTNLKTKRRSRAEVQKLVEEFRRSDTRRVDFCRDKRLSLSTLARHLRKSKRQERSHKNRTAAANRMLRVEIAATSHPPRTANSGVVVVLSGGRRVEVQADFDVLTLHRLITALEPA